MSRDAKTEFIEQSPIFSILNSIEREELVSRLDYEVYKRHSFIYLPDDPSDKVYFLEKGSVKIGSHSADGKEIIKNLILPKAMFGELGMIGENQRQDFAQALKEEVVVFSVKVEHLRKLMRQNFELCNILIQILGNRLMKAENKLEALIFKDARTRIVDFIKDSVIRQGRQVGYEMFLKHSLTHQDIANITCTSRQTVTLVLNELRKLDLIYFNRGKILVRDVGKLA